MYRQTAKQLGFTDRVCCPFVIKLKATSLRDFCIILSGDLLFSEFNSMIRCLHIYLPLEQMAFNTSATECHSWLHRALLMSWATQMLFFFKPSSYLLWGFYVSF